MNEIDKIASKHLGKSSEGTLSKPYETPNEINTSFLVAIPRELNRTFYGIDGFNLPFLGYDVWNCYEVSFLLNNGFPVNCIAKIIYSSQSNCIIESKSLKLYLNSFNMVKLGENIVNASYTFKIRIKRDLEKILKTNVDVSLFLDESEAESPPISDVFLPIEKIVNIESIDFSSYNENPNLLYPIKNNGILPLYVKSNCLRSNCRVTNQPDWGDVYIYMDSEYIPTLESLLQYIVSMRKENHFHEEICECIYKRLFDKFKPNELFVACLYTRRGGIDINPIRASNEKIIDKLAKNIISSGIRVRKNIRQ